MAESNNTKTNIRRKYYLLRKGISVCIVLTFILQQIVWAQNAQTGVMNSVSSGVVRNTDKFYADKIQIPYDIAKKDKVVSSGSDEVIVHIQDAHASLSAQYSIAGILDHLVSDYDLSFVALEGSSGYVDTSILKTFPDKEIRKDTAEYLMRKGRMSAGEFFSITNDEKEVTLYGIEDNELYKKNLESFRNVAAQTAEKIKNINAFLRQADALAGAVYSDDLMAFVKNSELHRMRNLSFVDHWEKIKKLARKKGVLLTGYKEIQKLIGSIELERGINFEKANEERAKLVEVLSRVLPAEGLEALVLKSVELKKKKISQETFHEYLVRLAGVKGIPMDKYKNLKTFIKYIRLYSSIDLMWLYREIAAVEDLVREKLYTGNDERQLFFYTRIAFLLKQLYSIELNNNEFRYLEKQLNSFDPESAASFLKSACRKYNVPEQNTYDIDLIFRRENIRSVMKFYLDAESRNSSMLSNTISNMRREGKNVAALISGGYHTVGLTGLMDSRKLSYLVIVPRFESGSERPYVAILTNKNKPYRKLLETGKYQLAIEAYFSAAGGNLDRIKSSIFYALGEARLKGKDVQSIKKIWSAAYRSRYKNIITPRKKDIPFTPVTPDEFDHMLNSRVKIKRSGKAVVIADVNGKDVEFVSLVRAGALFEFSPATKQHKQLFSFALDSLDEKDPSSPDIEGMIKFYSDEKQDLMRRLKTEQSRIIEAVRKRLKGKRDAGEKHIRNTVISVLKRKGLPNNWEEDSDFLKMVDILSALIEKDQKKEITKPGHGKKADLPEVETREAEKELKPLLKQRTRGKQNREKALERDLNCGWEHTLLAGLVFLFIGREIAMRFGTQSCFTCFPCAYLLLVGTVYLIQALDMRYNLVPEIIEHIKSRRISVRIKIFYRRNKYMRKYFGIRSGQRNKLIGRLSGKPDVAENKKDKLVYVRGKMLYVNAGEMERRPFFMQDFYYLHERLHMGNLYFSGFNSELLVYAVHGLIAIPYVILRVSRRNFKKVFRFVKGKFNFGAKDVEIAGAIDPSAFSPEKYPKDIGTAGTGSRKYRENFSERRVVEDIFEDDRFVRIVVDSQGHLGIPTIRGVGVNASKKLKTLKEQLKKINYRDSSVCRQFRQFISDNSHLIKKMTIFLVEPMPVGMHEKEAGGDISSVLASKKKERLHPHLITHEGRDWQAAFSGSNNGRYPVVYMTRAFFEDMPVEHILLPVLKRQITRAVLLKYFWNTHAGVSYPEGQHNPEVQGILNRISNLEFIRKEIEESSLFQQKGLRDRFRIEKEKREDLLEYIAAAADEFPKIGSFQHLRKCLQEFDRFIDLGSFDSALEQWGIFSFKIKDFLTEEGEVSGFLKNRLQFFLPIFNKTDEIMRQYVNNYGIYNKLGKEQGTAVGRVVIINDFDDEEVPDGVSGIEKYFAKADGDEIWVYPRLTTRLDHLKGKGIIVSVAGDPHSRSIARSHGIPMAVIPDAVHLLEPFNGKQCMLRVGKDGVVRVRLAHEDEVIHKRSYRSFTPLQEVRVPVAVLGGEAKLVFELEDVDMCYVNRVGYKAANMGHIMKSGINANVPPGAVLTHAFADVFFKSVINTKDGTTLEDFINELMRDVPRENDKITKEHTGKLKVIQEMIMRKEMPDNLKKVIIDTADKLRSRYGDMGFYVRSSFNFEDLPEASVAGQYESFPDGNKLKRVTTDEDLIKAVKLVIAEKYSLSAFRTRLSYKVRDEEVFPAIVIQMPAMSVGPSFMKKNFPKYKKLFDKWTTADLLTNIRSNLKNIAECVKKNKIDEARESMKLVSLMVLRLSRTSPDVEGETMSELAIQMKKYNRLRQRLTISGVINTFESVTKDKGRVEILAGLGPGSIVAGEGNPAKVFFDKLTNEPDVKSKVSLIDKRRYFEEGRLFEEDVSSEDIFTEVLTDSVSERLNKAAREIEDLFSNWTQDIEWMLTPENELFIVQARPIPEMLLDTEVEIFAVGPYTDLLPHIKDKDLVFLEKLREAGDVDELIEALHPESSDIEFNNHPDVLAKRYIASIYLNWILKKDDISEEVTGYQVKKMVMFSKNSPLFGWRIYEGLSCLDEELIPAVKDFMSSVDVVRLFLHPGKLEFADIAFKLGLYDKGIEALKALPKGEDKPRSVPARVLRIAEKRLIYNEKFSAKAKEEFIMILRNISQRFQAEPTGIRAQKALNRMAVEMDSEGESPEIKVLESAIYDETEELKITDESSSEEEITLQIFLKVVNQLGIHLKPSTALLIAAKSAKVDITFADGMEISMRKLVTMRLVRGAEFTIRASGKKSQIDEFVKLIRMITDINPHDIEEPVYRVAVEGQLEIQEEDEPSADTTRIRRAREMLKKKIFSEYVLVIGINDKVYDEMGEEKIKMLLNLRKGQMVIVKFESEDAEQMAKELMEFKEYTAEAREIIKGRKIIGMIIDTTLEEYKEALEDRDEEDGDPIEGKVSYCQEIFFEKIIKTLHPDLSVIVEEVIPAGESMRGEVDTKNVIKDKEGMKADLEDLGYGIELFQVILKNLPALKPIKLDEKSIYDIRIHNIFGKYRKDYSEEMKKYFNRLQEASPAAKKQYIITAVDSAGDLRLLAESIRDRRQALEITKQSQDIVEDFVVIKNRDIMYHLKEWFEVSGLSEFISTDNVIDVADTEELSLDDLLEELNEKIESQITPSQIAIGARAGIIDLKLKESIALLSRDKNDRMLLVQMEDGLISQLYRVLLEVLSNNSEIPHNIPGGLLSKKEKYNLFNYFPKVEPKDTEEIRHYTPRLTQIMA